jgi:hypothetical protein
VIGAKGTRLFRDSPERSIAFALKTSLFHGSSLALPTAVHI